MEIWKEDLSPQLKTIAEVIGLDETIILARALGGRLLKLSRKSPPHQVIKAIGVDAADKLCELYDGVAIELNTIERTEGRAIARSVYKASDDGLNTLQICEQLSLSRATVRSILKRRNQVPKPSVKDKEETVIQLGFFM
jgi:hypothetical protein